MFCPKCGSILVPKTENNKRVLACKCGYSINSVKDPTIKEEVKQKDEIELIEKEPEPHPLIEAECPKCKHKKAYFWTVQTRASDEPETKFFKCEKCENVWRDYD